MKTDEGDNFNVAMSRWKGGCLSWKALLPSGWPDTASKGGISYIKGRETKSPFGGNPLHPEISGAVLFQRDVVVQRMDKRKTARECA